MQRQPGRMGPPGGNRHMPPGKPPSIKNWGKTLKGIWSYLSNYKSLLFLILLMVLLSSGLGLLGPYLVGVSVDRFIGTTEYSGLIMLIVMLGLVYLGHSISTWLQNFWMIGIAQRTIYQMRKDLFRHLQRLPLSFFNKRQHGEIMSRLTNDIENVSQTLNSSFIQLFSSILTFVGMITIMIILSPLLTLLTLTIVPLMFFGMKWITARTSKYFKEQQRNLGDLNGFVEETFSGQRVIKSYSQENKVVGEFKEKNARLKQSGYWAQVYSGFIPKLMNTLNNFSFTMIAAAGGLLAINGLVTVGVIVTFAEYARQFTRPLNDLANQFNTFLSAVAGAERVFEVMEEPEEELDESQAKEMPAVRGEIEFADVSFSYTKEGQQISDLSFHVEPGEMVALVGATGAGKSTVVQLLSRFYEIDSGHILIDGHNIQHIKRQSLRSQMGFVLQDSFLFQGSIRENIRYGRLDATDEEIEESARLANAHSFIMKMPQQYDTLLDQDGSGISQGQKQLLSIARAILADPAILILDEATSSIDTITELKIQEALGRLMKDRTSIVIAHRLNTIQKADQILVLEDGRLLEKGNHAELLRHRGFYYGLYNSQFKEEAAARA